MAFYALFEQNATSLTLESSSDKSDVTMMAAAPGAEGGETRTEKTVMEEESSRMKLPSASQAETPPPSHPDVGGSVRMKAFGRPYFTCPPGPRRWGGNGKARGA